MCCDSWGGKESDTTELGSVKGGLCSTPVHVESKLENSPHFSKGSLLICTAGSGVCPTAPGVSVAGAPSHLCVCSAASVAQSRVLIDEIDG